MTRNFSYPKHVWVKDYPDSQGIPSRLILSMLNKIRQSSHDVHSLLIWRHGRLVFEQYFAPYSAADGHAVYSCSKALTVLLISIAQARGLLNVEDYLMSYIDDPSAYPESRLRRVKIRYKIWSVPYEKTDSC